MPNRSPLRRWLVVAALAAVALVLLAIRAWGGSDADTLATGSTPAAPAASTVEHPFTKLGTRQLPDGWYATDYQESQGEVTLVEVSQTPPGTVATPEQQAAADDFAARVKQATAGVSSIDDARAAGYEAVDQLGEAHLVNRAYLDDGRVLDPERPEFLVFSGDGRLLGVMFYTQGTTSHGPQVGGPLTVWHYHPWGTLRCIDLMGLPGEATPDPATGACPGGLTAADKTPEMLHLWFDTDGNPFASPMGGGHGMGH